MSPLLPTSAAVPAPGGDPAGGLLRRASAVLGGVMEGVVALMVVFSAWAFGGWDAISEMSLVVATAVLLVLWAARMLLEWRLLWAGCPILFCLLGMFFLGVWQMTPLPPGALAWLSPETDRLMRELLPRQPEHLPGGDAVPAGALTAGSAISLSPATTAGLVLRLLGAAALYAAVRSGVASAGSFRRLAVVALVNGVLLSLVGLFQFVTSRPDVVYWTFAVPYQAFGPMYRNAFACHANIALGLGLGLLCLAGVSTRSPGRRRGQPALSQGWRDWLNNPAVLWVGAGMVLMISALLFSLSRAGFLSFLLAAAACALVALGSVRLSAVGGVLVTVVLALGLVAWMGADPVQKRLATLWPKDSVEDERLDVWLQTLPCALKFPVWGAGYGMFPYLEQMTRPPRVRANTFYQRAHNEYHEMLLEGGAVGLALGVFAVALVFRAGRRAFSLAPDAATGALALGGLFAFTALAVHCFFDFLLHIPATAVFAIVLTAQLAALGSSVGAATAEKPSAAGQSPAWGVRSLGCVLGVAGVGVVAAVLWHEGVREMQAGRYWLAALGLAGEPGREAQARRTAYLQALTKMAPGNAVAQFTLADLQRAQWSRSRPSADRQGGDRFPPFLRHYLVARNLNPMMEQPHIALAGFTRDLKSADPVGAYLRRARLVAPYEAGVWYVSGLRELEDGRPQGAWECWRRCLVCSNEFAREVVERSAKRLGPEEVLSEVLPDDAELVFEAAGRVRERPLYEDAFLRRALALLEESGRRDVAGLARKGQIYARLNRPDEALAVFDEVVLRAPSRLEWRLEYARLLYDRGRLPEARIQLRSILDQEPANKPAGDLYGAVVRQIADAG